jgi:1-(5-phosphoribosyl)-5-[(5-phosphoribosylamino)methylideneamino] imidazole-4-carboxamide isomerase/N-(5'phosphoribosyl)anthranilate isomerase
MPNLILLPAVDVADGQAVRLEQAAAGSEKSFGDPLEVAESFVEQGAEWLHLVDLDAAFSRGENTVVIRRVVSALAGKLRIQLSGGIRDEASLNRALDAGVRRVNLGTAALSDIDFVTRAIREHGDRVVVGIDVRGTTLTARGGTGTLGELFDVLPVLEEAGAARYIVTDVDTDGMMTGPNMQLLRDVCERTNAPVIASGGIATLDDIARLRDLVPVGVEGAILGKALYEGAFTLREALAVANGA